MAKKKKEEEVTNIQEEVMIAPGVYAKDVTKFDNMGDGMYKIELENGSVHEVSLDEGEIAELDQTFRLLKGDASNSEGGIPSAEDMNESPLTSRTPMERILGRNQHFIEFKDPDMRGYWPLTGTEDVRKRVAYGYRYAIPEDIKDYDLVFSELNPGQGTSPNAMVESNGHVLLVAINL